MNHERQELLDGIVEYIVGDYDYATSHCDAAENYSVLLNSGELEHRASPMFFSNNSVGAMYNIHGTYALIDVAYLGQEELEIPLDYYYDVVGVELNADDIKYIEHRAECTVIVREHGIYAYMMFPDISVRTIVDVSHDCNVVGILDYHAMYDIAAGVAHCGWQVEFITEGRKV